VACGGSSSTDESSASSSASGAKLEEITTVVAPVFNDAAYLAQERGFFRDEGLDVTLKVGGEPSAQIPLLLRNDAQIAISGDVTVVTAVAKGLPIKLVLGVLQLRPGDENGGVVVRKDSGIRSMKDLTGKTVAVTSLHATTDLLIRHGIDQEGGSSARTKFVVIPNQGMIAALTKGTVDAAYLLQPFYQQAAPPTFEPLKNPAVEDGSPLLGSPAMSFVAANSYIAQHGEVVKKFQRAMLRAYKLGEEDPELLRQQLAKRSKLSPEALKATTFDYNGAIDRDALAATTADMLKYGFLDKAPSVQDLVWDEAPAS
jgi:NitT/TauT family transport system substrate-binding protein